MTKIPVDKRALNLDLSISFVQAYTAYKFGGSASCFKYGLNSYGVTFEIPNVGNFKDTFRVRKNDKPLIIIERLKQHLDKKFGG